MTSVLPQRPMGIRTPSAASGPSYRSKHSADIPSHTSDGPSPAAGSFDLRAVSNSSLESPQKISHQSSTSRKRKRKVRPQYPLETTEKHVEYILVASFDIDRGSVMEHQHPAPIGGDEPMLAELMLPDGAHVRKEDWTIFFLHKDAASLDAPPVDDDSTPTNDTDYDNDEADAELDDDTLHGPPLIYVLNLVITKSDSTAKRGAVCKAMAICTRHPFLHIYKPLLLLALENYFRAPVPDTLANLYEAVNDMDLSLLPKLSSTERIILQSSDVKDMFVEQFNALIQQRTAANASNLQESPSHSRQKYTVPRDTHEFESVIRYNGIPVPVKVPTALPTETIGDFSLISLIQTFSNPHVSSPQPFATTHAHLTTSGPLTHPIIVLMNALLTQKRVMMIGHSLPSSQVAEAVLAACSLVSGGLLRGFVRHAFPYTDLTKIDDLLKVPGFIAGVTNPTFSIHAEWWDLLCDLQTGRMQISSKIEPAPSTEGTTFFQPSGHGITMLQNAGVNPASLSISSATAPDVTGDHAFLSSVLAAIAERQGEASIRARFRHWILKFTRLAAAFEEVVYGANMLNAGAPSPESSPTTPLSAKSFGAFHASTRNAIIKGNGFVWTSQAEKLRELAVNATRIEGWTKTRSYLNFVQDVETYHARRAVKDIDLQHLHDKLTRLRLGADTAGFIYIAICEAVQSDEQINELLVTVGNTVAGGAIQGGGIGALTASVRSPAGLFHLALGLFHPRQDVREAVAGLLSRIRTHEAGRHFWDRMSGFEKAAWARVDAQRTTLSEE